MLLPPWCMQSCECASMWIKLHDNELHVLLSSFSIMMNRDEVHFLFSSCHSHKRETHSMAENLIFDFRAQVPS